MRNLSILMLVCLLPGCAASTYVEPAPVTEAEEMCEGPTELPNRALNDAEIEVYWGRDRTNLRICKAQVDALRKK